MPVSLSNVLTASKFTVTAVVSHWSPALVNVIFGFGVFDWKNVTGNSVMCKMLFRFASGHDRTFYMSTNRWFFFLTERSVLGFSGLLWVHFHIHARSHSSACPLALCFFLRWGSSLPFCFLFLLFCSLPCSRFASLPPSPWFLLLAREVRVRACGCKWYRSRFDSICRMLIPSDFAPSGCLRWPFSASSLVTYPPSSPVVLPSACFLFPLFFALLHGLTHTHTHNLNIQTPKEYWGTLRTTKVSFRMWHARQCPLQWRCEACRMCEPIRNAAWLTLAPWQHYLLRV